MRILHVTRDYPTRSTGGLSTAVGGLVKACVKAGLGKKVISFDGWRPKSNTKTLSISFQEDQFRVTAKDQLEQANRFASDYSPHIIHVHSSMLWPFAHALAQEVGSKTVFHLHVDQYEQNRLRGVKNTQSSTAQERAFGEADLVMAPSQAALAAVGDANSKAVVVPFGITSCCDVTSSFSDKPSALYAARFSDMRGTDRLIKLAEFLPTFEIRVAGGIPENHRNDEKWRKRLREKDNITLLGWRTRTELCKEMTSASLFLAPCRAETFGFSVAEALFHGLPVLGFSVGALPERLASGGGVLVPDGDLGAFAASANELLSDKQELKRLQKRALLTRNGLSWNERIPSFLDAYKKLLATH